MIYTVLNLILDQNRKLMTILDTLTADVAAQKTIVASVVTLLAGIKVQLDAALAANDPAALKALSDQIEANSKALSDAVVASTPASSVPSGVTVGPAA